jgi:hypothetical protein
MAYSGLNNLAIPVLQRKTSASNQKTPEEQEMSIEKKSLISNRAATKKAIATKPEVSKVTANKTSMLRTSSKFRVVAGNRIASFRVK